MDSRSSTNTHALARKQIKFLKTIHLQVHNSHYKTLETRFPTLGCVGIFFKTLEHGLFEALPASFPEGCGRLYTPPADVGRSFDVRITRLSVRRFIELDAWFTLASFPEGCWRLYTPPADVGRSFDVRITRL